MPKPAVSLVGGSGYVGGELLRLLLSHPGVALKQIVSRHLAGRSVTKAHPNLRGHTRLVFCRAEELENCDLLFLCLPHGSAMEYIDEARRRAILDLAESRGGRQADGGG